MGDITDSVNFARENELLVAVRGGGHNVAGNAAGNAACDGGLIIELRDGKMWRDTRYYAEPFEAPEWGSQWVEQMEP